MNSQVSAKNQILWQDLQAELEDLQLPLVITLLVIGGA